MVYSWQFAVGGFQSLSGPHKSQPLAEPQRLIRPLTPDRPTANANDQPSTVTPSILSAPKADGIAFFKISLEASVRSV